MRKRKRENQMVMLPPAEIKKYYFQRVCNTVSVISTDRAFLYLREQGWLILCTGDTAKEVS